MPSAEFLDPSHFLVHAGWLIDGTGGPVRTGCIVEIKSGFILSITPAPLTDRSPQNTKTDTQTIPLVDARNHLMLPGLMDSHVHLAWSATSGTQVRKYQFFAPYREARERIIENLNDSIHYGIIAIRDGGDHYGHALKYKLEEARFSPFTLSIRACGKAVFRQGRYGGIIGEAVPVGDGILNTVEKIPKHQDHLKIVNSGLNSLSLFGKETESQFDPDTLGSIISAAKKKGLKVMVHANGRKSVMDAVSAGCDSIEHGFFMGPEALNLLVRMGTVWVPTAVTMKALSETLAQDSPEADMARRNLDHQLEQIDLARRLGVTIAAGTDAGGVGVFHGKSVLKEIALLITAGFSMEEAIRCATKTSADLLGMEEEGVLAPGKAASFILVRGPAAAWLRQMEPAVAVYLKGKKVHTSEGYENR